MPQSKEGDAWAAEEGVEVPIRGDEWEEIQGAAAGKRRCD